MPEYTVHFITEASFSAKVNADDPDKAIERAYDQFSAPSSFVYASHPLGFNMGGEWEPESVIDASGDEVWVNET
jgi:hypothetical protein